MATPHSLKQKLDRTFRGQLTTGGQLLNTFEAEIPAATPREKTLEPRFWFSQVGRIRAFDRVECTWEDGSRILTLRCMGVDARAGEVLMEVERETVFEAPDLPKGFSYDFVNRSVGWRIFQEGRRSAIGSGFATARAAHHWFMGERAISSNDDAPEQVKPAKSAAKPAARPAAAEAPAS